MVSLTRKSKPNEVKDWFTNYDEGRFAAFVDVFAGVDGKELLGYREEQLERIMKNSARAVGLFNILHEGETKGIFVNSTLHYIRFDLVPE